MDDGEVASPDLGGVVLEEGRPGLASFATFLRQIALDGAFADFDAELKQLPSDPFRSPQPIFLGQLLDEGDGLGGDMRLVLVGFRFVSPIDPEQLALPMEEGVRLHNVQGLLPKTGKSCQDDQAKTIVVGQPWALDLAVEDNQLLTQHSVFYHQVSPATGQVCQSAHCE